MSTSILPESSPASMPSAAGCCSAVFFICSAGSLADGSASLFFWIFLRFMMRFYELCRLVGVFEILSMGSLGIFGVLVRILERSGC